MDNCLLFDWLTVSLQDCSFSDCVKMLGMESKTWEDQKSGSRMRYACRAAYDGISIHYTPNAEDTKHTPGACIEMSGQGCRDFETFGHKDWVKLFDLIDEYGGTITRLDVAYDDFRGLLPIDIIADCARLGLFTSRSQSLQIFQEWKNHTQRDRAALTVMHGSRSSDFAIRIYDKRAEKNAWDDFEHWVRFEIQMRKGCAGGFVEQLRSVGNLGETFAGVVNNYLEYQCATSDSNRSRALPAPWWTKFLQTAAVLRIHSTKDVEYNLDRMLAHVDRNHNPIKSAILAVGLDQFLQDTFGHVEPLPDKYKHILQAQQNSDDILRILKDKPKNQIAEVVSGLFDAF